MTTPTMQTREARMRRRRRLGTGDRSAALLLLLATAVAIAWANSPWGASYDAVWHETLTVSFAGFEVQATLHGLVNDGIMTFFFFVVGLEVKHEFTLGELADRSRAIVPVVAAVAGLALPALIFVAFTAASGEASAWGVVISTDTAFLLGALALVAPNCPARLRTFLLTLSVVDDIGALLAIAVFYNSGIRPLPLAIAVVIMVAVALVRFLRAGRGFTYFVLGVALWIAVAQAGIHPTLAGVAMALLIPVYPPRRDAVERTARSTRAFRESPSPAYAAEVTRGLRDSLSINDRLQAAWGPYVSFLVLPLFALANAGVRLDGATLAAALVSPLTWGIVAGLVLGKFVGITGATALMVRFGPGRLAPGLQLSRIAGGAALSGIGFTIALFLVPIALPDQEQQDLARVGILAASVIAFLLGWAILGIGERRNPSTIVGATLSRPVEADRDHVFGPFEARYTIVEYGDFECPFCSRATGSVNAVLRHFGDDVRWVWRHLPLESVHPHARMAAQASEAASIQGRFFEMAGTLFDHQKALEFDDLVGYARDLELDVDRFVDDLISMRVEKRVEDDVLDAEDLDLHATPTFYVNGRRHTGPWDSATLIAALEDPDP